MSDTHDDPREPLARHLYSAERDQLSDMPWGQHMPPAARELWLERVGRAFEWAGAQIATVPANLARAAYDAWERATAEVARLADEIKGEQANGK